MRNYDFSILSPYEFESFVRDILSKREELDFNNYPEGRDSGIDLRSTTPEGQVVIVQVKRYKDYSNLVRVLKKEVEKVKKLSPDRYIIATSLDLTAANKSDILEIFAPYVLDERDVLSKQDFNKLLDHYPDIELQYYKLWLTSTNVLNNFMKKRIVNNASFELQEIKETVKTYVMNPCFDEAMKVLKEHRYVIISGDPGIGKTSLARMLVYVLLSKKDANYDQFYFIPKEIDDASEVFQEGVKQVFFFDDFLGNTRFTPEKNFDSRLVNFIHAVQRSKDKLFIMSTREYILNDAKNYYTRIEQNDLELAKCIVDMGKYNKWIRGQILYNHLVDSGMPVEYLSEIRAHKNYMKIIDHVNFNPRIIESFVKQSLHETCSPHDYMKKIIGFFDNPRSVWKDAFEQLPKTAREMLLVLATMSPVVLYTDWKRAYSYFFKVVYPHEGYLDERAWENYVRLLQDSFIIVQGEETQRYIDYHNPGIKDFVIDYISKHSGLQRLLLENAFFIEQLYSIFQEKESIFADIKVDEEFYPIVMSSFERCSRDYHTCQVYRVKHKDKSFSYKSTKESFVAGLVHFSSAYKKILRLHPGFLESFLTDDNLKESLYDTLSILNKCNKKYLQVDIHRLFTQIKESSLDVYEMSEFADSFNGVFSEFSDYAKTDEFLDSVELAVLASLDAYSDPNDVDNFLDNLKKALPHWDSSEVQEAVNLRIGEYEATIEGMYDDRRYYEDDPRDSDEYWIDDLFSTLIP